MRIPRYFELLALAAMLLVAPGAHAQIVPFIVQVQGGICNTAAVGSANPEVIIDAGGLPGTFVVTGVLMKTDDVPNSGFVAFQVNHVIIDGTLYATNTENVLGPVTGANDSVDIMGVPVTPDGTDAAGSFPHQIVATSPGLNDIVIRFFCRSDIDDMNIESVAVSGWRRLQETISVTYVPGS